MDIYYVIKEPLITEKMAAQAGEDSRYCFKVDTGATKDDVKRAVETIFNVKVAQVRTLIMKGKTRLNPRTRRPIKSNVFKKAIVTLKKGNKIQLFEGV